MEFVIYPRLGTFSKRLMKRRNYRLGSKRGQTYHYEPRRELIDRLAQELTMNPRDVRRQIFKERLHLLREIYGNTITEADV